MQLLDLTKDDLVPLFILTSVFLYMTKDCFHYPKLKMKFDPTKDMLSLFTAVFIVDFIFVVLIRYYLGKSVNNWYDQFGISAILSDVFSIVMVIVIAYIIYIRIFGKKDELDFADLITLIGITILVQLVHDLSLYVFVIKTLPAGHNKMIDVFREYGDYGGFGILGVDALMMALSIIVFVLISNNLDDEFKLLCFVLIFYAIQYIIYTPRKIPDTVLDNISLK